MVFNKTLKPGQSLIIKTPGNHSFDDISKHLKSNGEVIINHSLYPDGFEIKMTQMANKIIITSNMELIENDDGSFSINTQE